MPISLYRLVSGKQSNRSGIPNLVYVYTAKSESPGNHAPVPTKRSAKLVPHRLSQTRSTHKREEFPRSRGLGWTNEEQDHPTRAGPRPRDHPACTVVKS